MPEQRCTCPPVTPPFDAVASIDCPVHGDQAAALVVAAIDQGRVIQAEPPGRCALCGKVEETRPYGPNGEDVCFSCGMQDKVAAEARFRRRFGGDRA